MRLLNTRTGELKSFDKGDVPDYAILSHVWDGYEQTFQDVQKLGRRRRVHAPGRSLFSSLPPGLSAKLRGACKFAAALQFEWVWVDTCCINKESSAELSEAINSMFKWYSEAEICIAYFADVRDDLPDLTKEGSDFWKSTWFTRGWTLQELIAPRKVLFVSKGWKAFGTKAEMAATVEAITGVNKEVLTPTPRSLSSISIAERMSWAADRRTTRVEDRAYSLLGIFEVYMSTVYGEGMHAFRRLQEELLRSSPDQTLFAWGFSHIPLPVLQPGIFADDPSPFLRQDLRGLFTITIEEIPRAMKAFLSVTRLASASFTNSTNTLTSPSPNYLRGGYNTPTCTVTHYGIRARMPLLSRKTGNNPYSVAILAARDQSGYVGLVLRRLLEADDAHYAAGMHGFRLVHVGADPSKKLTPNGWAGELGLAHDDVEIGWQDIYITTGEPWRAQIRPAVEDMPLELLSKIPLSDTSHFRDDSHHTTVARRCLAILNRGLSDDLCLIGDPSLANTDLSRVAGHLKDRIPKELQHACKLWLIHLPRSSLDSELLQELSTFTDAHLLHWVEVLSILRELRIALIGLPAAFKWLSDNALIEAPLFGDADRLIRTYRDILNTSTSQLYHGILMFNLPNCDLSRKLPPPKVKLLSRPRSWTSLLGTMKVGDGVINSVAFLPDDIHIVCGSANGSISIWDYRALECITRFSGRHRAVYAVACSLDRRFVASCGDLADVTLSGMETRSPPQALVGRGLSQRAVAFSADSSQISAGSDDGSVCVWWTASGEIVHTLAGHTDQVTAIAFSQADGAILASSSRDGTIRIRNIAPESGEEMHILRDENWPTAVSFSPDGWRIVSGSWEGSVRIWDVETSNVILTIPGHKGHVTFVAFISHGSCIISSSKDGTIRKCDATTGDCLSTFTSSRGAIASSSISQDGSRMVSASGDTIEIWDANAPPESAELVGHAGAVRAVDFALDGETFATSSLDRTVRLWKTSTAELLRIIPHNFSVHAIRFSPDGAVLATASSGQTIHMFETGSWQEVGCLTWPPNLGPVEVWSIVFSTDGSHIACGTKGSVAAWKVDSRECIAAFRVKNGADALAFSPDMASIAIGPAAKDANILVWDLASGHSVTVQLIQSQIHSLEFSSNGRHLVSRGYDGTVSTGTIPSPASRGSSSVDVDKTPLRFSWHRDFAGERSLGWLHFTAGAGKTSKPVCWFPPERRPSSCLTCYAWHGDVVVVGCSNGMVMVMNLADAVSSL